MRFVEAVEVAVRSQDIGGGIGRRVQSRIYSDGAYGRLPAVPVDADALAAAAGRRMSRRARAYVMGSAGAESTADANRATFARWRLVPRMLVDVSTRDTTVELFGRTLPMPFLLSPIGVLEMVHREADIAVARSAAELGIPMVQSNQASRSMEECAAAVPATAPRWFQLYWSSDDDLVASLVSRAEASGCEAIVVTLDTHQLGWRPRDLDVAYLPFARGQGLAQYTSDPVFTDLVHQRAQRISSRERRFPTVTALATLASMARTYPGGFAANLRSPLPRAAVETFLDVFSRSSLTWQDLAFLRRHTRLPILLKGIQHVDDAARALDAGMDGIVVSNHGGRQVDGAIASLEALPAIVSAVDGAVPVLFDSGVRTGSDAFKAIALGATAVCVGRPFVYGLTLAGTAGVTAVMSHLMAEFDLTMGLTGCQSITDISSDLLREQ